MEKLTIEKLVPYLPYKLKAEILDFKSDYIGNQYDIIVGFIQWSHNGKLYSILTEGGAKPSPNRIKPILRPLSDLTKEIEVNGEKFVPKNKFDHEMSFYSNSVILEMRGYERVNLLDHPIKIINQLFEWHFDVFGLIEKGLAIDINTL